MRDSEEEKRNKGKKGQRKEEKGRVKIGVQKIRGKARE